MDRETDDKHIFQPVGEEDGMITKFKEILGEPRRLKGKVSFDKNNWVEICFLMGTFNDIMMFFFFSILLIHFFLLSFTFIFITIIFITIIFFFFTCRAKIKKNSCWIISND